MKVKLHSQKRPVDEAMSNIDGSWWLLNSGDSIVITDGRIFNVREQKAKHGDLDASMVTLMPEEGIEYSVKAFGDLSVSRPLGRILKFV